MPSTEYASALPGSEPKRRGSDIFRALWHGLLTTGTVLIGLLVGLGWLWELRHQGAFRSGPLISDALPLLQLAGFDRQPLLRVAVAWVIAGLTVGLLLRRHRPIARAAVAGATGAVLLWFASQASDALTRNLRFSDVLAHRSVGLGPWIEAAIFAAVSLLIPKRREPPEPPERYRHQDEYHAIELQPPADGYR
ncbi:MAG: hypothetical protein ACYDHH_31940 [Solirubrobacteraceae bacterium]